MKEQFITGKFSSGTSSILAKAMVIIDTYAEDGYVLTLRQLYYQLVTQNIIPNHPKEYSKLSYLMVKARMSGLVDWDAIEDRTRRPYLPYWAFNMVDALNDMRDQFRINRQENQDNTIEVWCEKDALSGVLSRLTNKYHIRLCVNRGYSSATAMYDAAKRLNVANAHILYLGDHDPSGLDMIRDIEDRLEQFGCTPIVHRLALTYDQIKEYDPPINPTKWKDRRSKKYVEKFGEKCWEVDALPPKVLNKILKDAIEQLVDPAMYSEMLDLEDEQRERIGKEIKLIKRKLKREERKRNG